MAEKPMRCYRTACNNAAHPCGYNRVTHGLYCLDCARNINTGGAEGGPLFPLLRHRWNVTAGGSWETGIILVRKAQTKGGS